MTVNLITEPFFKKFPQRKLRLKTEKKQAAKTNSFNQ